MIPDPSLITRKISRAKQPLSRVNLTGLARHLQVKIENIYLFKIIKQYGNVLNTGLAQSFSCCPENMSCPKFGGGGGANTARTPMGSPRVFSVIIVVWLV